MGVSTRAKKVRAGPQGTGHTYVYHGHEEESCRGSLHGAIGLVDQIVDGEAGQDHADGEEANESNMVGLGGFGCDNDEDADDEAKHMGETEPPVVIEVPVVLGGRDGRAHEGNEPGQL